MLNDVAKQNHLISYEIC